MNTTEIAALMIIVLFVATLIAFYAIIQEDDNDEFLN